MASPDERLGEPGTEPRIVASHRPRVVDDLEIIGLTRWSRGRIGSRVFRGFFLLVFGVIVVQLVVSLLHPFP